MHIGTIFSKTSHHLNIIGYFLILGWSPTIWWTFYYFYESNVEREKNSQTTKQNKKQIKTKMTLLDHTLSCFFVNTKKVKTYPHKYEKNEKEKEMV
jgi:hypothetical protein